MGFVSYIPAEGVVHRLDARVKLAVLLAFSVAVFCVRTWAGLGACAVAVVAVAALSRVSARRYALMLVPVLGILAFICACNSIPFDLDRMVVTLQYAARILLVILASYVVTFSTTSTQLTTAIASFLKPLRVLHFPVDDLAFTLSLALRFIPLVFEEFSRIKAAQVSRAANFDSGSLWTRLKAWLVVFIPLFVGFFRRADSMAEAMDARCYGASDMRTSVCETRVGVAGWLVLACSFALCVACALLL